MEGNIIFRIACYMIIFSYLKNADANRKINYFNNVYKFCEAQKKRYLLAYQRLKHCIDCKMIKLIEFDDVKFYSVVWQAWSE